MKLSKFLFLMLVIMFIFSCGGNEETSKKECHSNNDCSKTQECRFKGKNSVSGECVDKKICKSDSECSDKRSCSASLIGTEKYCGGFLTKFDFKDNQKLSDGRVNEEYEDTIELVGQTGAFHIILKNGELPDGLMLNINTGDISGTPTKEGEYDFTLVAYNGASDAEYYYNIVKVEKKFSIKIKEAIVCTPNCDGKECGDDGCGGVCGTCQEGETCNDNGSCVSECVPNCDGKECGDDGCGDVCGICNSGNDVMSTCNSGYLCEQSDMAGKIVITELMPNPRSVADSKGEWIEIYNTTDSPIDLTNLKIIKDSVEKSIIIPEGQSSQIQPHSYFVIARSLTDSALNEVNAVSGFSLTNSGTHTVTIKLNEDILDTITYISSSVGKSWQVDPSLMDHDLNDYSFSWCKGSTVISEQNSDKGTPGAENLPCE